MPGVQSRQKIHSETVETQSSDSVSNSVFSSYELILSPVYVVRRSDRCLLFYNGAASGFFEKDSIGRCCYEVICGNPDKQPCTFCPTRKSESSLSSIHCIYKPEGRDERYRLEHKDGEINGVEIIVVHARNIEREASLQKESISFARILDASSKAISKLSAGKGWADGAEHALRELRLALRADVIYLRNIHQNNYYDSIVRTKDCRVPPVLFKHSLYKPLSRFRNYFASGRMIHSHVRELFSHEQDVFKGSGIASIFLVPVFVREELWGFLGCEFLEERRLNSLEVESLKSVALSVGNALRLCLFEKIVESRQELFRSGRAVTYQCGKDSDQILNQVSPNIFQFGFSPSEVCHKPFAQILHPEDRDRFIKNRRHQLEIQRKSSEQDYRVLGPDGETSWVYDCSSLVFDEYGNISGISGYLFDITEKVRSKQVEIEGQRKFHEIASNIDELFWVRDRDRFLYLSPAFEKIWGIPADSLLENAEIFFDRLHPEDLARVASIFDGALRWNMRFSEEFRILRPDGGVRWVRFQGTPSFQSGHRQHIGTASDITREKESEIELHKTRERFVLATNAGKVGIWDLSLDSDTPFCDALLYRMFDCELQNLSPFEVIEAQHHPDDWDSIPTKDKLREAFQLEEIHSSFRVYIRGELHRFRLRAKATYDRFGSPEKLTGIIADETMLMETESKLGLFFQSASTPFLICRKDRIENCNAAALEFFEAREEEQVIRHPLSRFCPNSTNHSGLYDSFAKMELDPSIDKLTTERIFLTTTRKSKTAMVTLSRSSLLRQDEYLLSLANIEKQYAREVALQESEAYFRSIANTTPVLIWLSNEEGKCTFFNETWLNFTGRTLEQEQGDGWSKGVHPEDRERCCREFMDSVRRQTSFTLQYRLRRKDGQYRQILDKGSPRYSSNNTFVGFAGCCVDITELHETKESLNRQKHLAERASRAKGEFLSNMSHELRTPLNAILGFSTLFGDDENLTHEQRAGLKTVFKCGKHLLALIDDILFYSNLEPEVTSPTLKDINTRPFLHELCEMYEALACEKKIVFSVCVENGVSAILRSDPMMLRQALCCLLSNAVKFTDQGQVELRVLEDKGHLVFRVTDSGCGIPDSRDRNIFQPFVQSFPDGMSRKGTGLGLSISKRICDLLEGTITHHPNRPRGSIFTLTIPIHSRSDEG